MMKKTIGYCLIIIIGVVLLSSSALAFSTNTEKFTLSKSASSELETPNTATNAKKVVSVSSGLSGSDLIVLLSGGRRYDSITREWSYFKPSGSYRDNLITSFLKQRKVIGGSIPSRVNKVLYSTNK